MSSKTCVWTSCLNLFFLMLWPSAFFEWFVHVQLARVLHALDFLCFVNGFCACSWRMLYVMYVCTYVMYVRM